MFSKYTKMSLCKPWVCCNFMFLLAQFSILSCDNAVVMLWLGLGTNNTWLLHPFFHIFWSKLYWSPQMRLSLPPTLFEIVPCLQKNTLWSKINLLLSVKKKKKNNNNNKITTKTIRTRTIRRCFGYLKSMTWIMYYYMFSVVKQKTV